MKKLTVAMTAALMMAAIAAHALTPEEMDRYLANPKSATEDRDAGKLSWSSYYRLAYESTARSNRPNKGASMVRYAQLAEAALEMEAGSITSEQFQVKRMRLMAEDQAERDTARGALVSSQNDAARARAAMVEDQRRRDQMAYEQRQAELQRQQLDAFKQPKTCTSSPNGIGGFQTTCR